VGGGLGMKTAKQEDAALPAFPFSFFFLLWLDVELLLLLLSLSAGRRISDVMVDNGIDECISSLSSQRSKISEYNEPALSDSAFPFAGDVGGWLGEER